MFASRMGCSSLVILSCHPLKEGKFVIAFNGVLSASSPTVVTPALLSVVNLVSLNSCKIFIPLVDSTQLHY